MAEIIGMAPVFESSQWLEVGAGRAMFAFCRRFSIHDHAPRRFRIGSFEHYRTVGVAPGQREMLTTVLRGEHYARHRLLPQGRSYPRPGPRRMVVQEPSQLCAAVGFPFYRVFVKSCGW